APRLWQHSSPEGAARQASPTATAETMEPLVGNRPNEGDGRLDVGAVPNLPPVPVLPPGTHLRRAEPPSDALSSEMRLLEEARASMEEDPGGALALLEQHRARFPTGALREEREAYAIEVLNHLGRPAEAERRYFDFAREFPESHFLPRIRRLVD